MSGNPAARPHYLRGNRGERSPSRLLVLDCETRWERRDDLESHHLRLWSAQLVRRHLIDPGEPRTANFEGQGIGQLLATIAAQATPKQPLWLFAHNLSFELAVTALPIHLRAQGWKLGLHNLASDAPWAHLTRKDRSLWLCDSFSWLPVSVEQLGRYCGVDKLPLPEPEDSDEAWFDRCRIDVQITALALCRLMDEWDARRLGWWSMTGPSSAWNSMLHAAHKQEGAEPAAASGAPRDYAWSGRGWKTRIDPHPEGRAFERGALFGGRRDCWRWGKMTGSRYLELDIKTAHASIAANFPLPAQRLRRYDSLPLTDWHLDSEAGAVIADALVEVSEPRYPVHHRGAILYPVGRFWTRLCSPELKDARERGELLAIGPAWSYALGRLMMPWARWLVDYLELGPADVDPLLWTFLKMASRSVPGRWGMLVQREIEKLPSPHLGWYVEDACFEVPPKRGAILHLAGEMWRLVRDQEADDSFPAVLAFIQSHCRLALNRALDTLPADSVIACNTEGVIAKASATRQLLPANAAISPLSLRVKRRLDSVEVVSPQHLRLDGDRRLSGIPRSAEETEPGEFLFWTWPKLRGQLKRPGLEVFTRQLREARLPLSAVTRWVYSCGCAEAPRIDQVTPEAPRAIQAPPPLCPRHQGEIMATQHQSLRLPLSAARIV